MLKNMLCHRYLYYIFSCLNIIVWSVHLYLGGGRAEPENGEAIFRLWAGSAM